MQGVALLFIVLACFVGLIPKLSRKMKVTYTEIVDVDPILILEKQKKQFRKKILLHNGAYALVIRDKELPYSVFSFCIGLGFYHDPPDRIGMLDLFIALLEERVQSDLIYDCQASFHAEKMSHRTSITFSIFDKNLERLCEHLADLLWESDISLQELNQAKEKAILSYCRSSRHRFFFHDAVMNVKLEGIRNYLDKVQPADLFKWIRFYFSPKEFRMILTASSALEKNCHLLSKFFSRDCPDQKEGSFLKKKIPPSSGKFLLLQQTYDRSYMTMVWRRPQPYSVDLPGCQRAEDLVRDLFSAKGEGSLFNILYTKGWIYSLDSSFAAQDNMGNLQLTIGLTEQGSAHWKEIMRSFHALPRHWLHSSNLAKYHQKRHETQLNFERFFLPQDWKEISRNLAKELLSGDFSLFPYYNIVPCFFDQKAFWNCLLEMSFYPADIFLYLSPKETRTILKTESLPSDYHNRCSKSFFLDSGKKSSLPSLLENYSLPTLNRKFFIKKNITGPPTKAKKKQPRLLKAEHSTGATLYSLQDFLSMGDHTYWSLTFHAPLQIQNELRQRLNWKLLQWMIRLHLEPFRAEVQGTQNKLEIQEKQLAWSLTSLGWSDQHQKLFFEALKQIFTSELQPTFFPEAQKALIEELTCSSFLRFDIAMGLEDPKAYQLKEQIRTLQLITFGELIGLFRNWTQSSPIEGFFVGSQNDNEIDSVWQEWLELLPFSPCAPREISVDASLFRMITEYDNYLVSYDIGPDIIEYQPYQDLLYQLFLDSIREGYAKNLFFESRRIVNGGRAYLQLSTTNLEHKEPSVYCILQVFERCLQKFQRMELSSVFQEIHPTLVSLYTSKRGNIPDILERCLREYLPIYSHSQKKRDLATIAKVMTPHSFQNYLEEISPHTWGRAFKKSLDTFTCYVTKKKIDPAG